MDYETLAREQNSFLGGEVRGPYYDAKKMELILKISANIKKLS